MSLKTLRQTVKFKASPAQVFEALMDAKKLARFTNSKVKISRKVGGSFSVFDGGLHGKNLEIVKNKKIVQSWRAEMDKWPKGHYSRATFSLKKIKGGTQLDFYQSKIPQKSLKGITEGWYLYYWNPMKKMLEK